MLLRHISLNGQIRRHFLSGGINGLATKIFATHQNSLTGLPPDPVGPELGVPIVATPNNYYWQQIPFWKDVSEAHFLSYQWQVKK